MAKRYHGQWTTREISDHCGWVKPSPGQYLRSLGLEPVGHRGASLLWDAQAVFDRLDQRAGKGANIRKAAKWPHPDGWLCRCRECMDRKQRQRDELTAHYRAERIWVEDHWEAPVPPRRHGLLSTATHRGCECGPCKARLASHLRNKPRSKRKRPQCSYPGCVTGARIDGLCIRHSKWRGTSPGRF